MPKTLKLDVVGLKHHLTTEQMLLLEKKTKLKPLKARFVREPENEYDKNAVAVYVGDAHVGYLRRTVAPVIAHGLDKGTLKAIVKLVSVSTYWAEAKVEARFTKSLQIGT